MILVIVESPAKAKTINKYLGSEYKVLASMGHVRDLPAKSGSIDPENDFEMKWEKTTSRAKTLREIEHAVEKSEKIVLATDPDREGEAISWHLFELLNKKKSKNFERVVFNAVTKDKVLDAINNPRSIDNDLVEAYKARRSLDYLIGFKISPILWTKLSGVKSAGRVQSVALKIICEREIEIENFKSQRYWSVTSSMSAKNGQNFTASLVSINENKLNKFDIKSEKEAKAIINNLNNSIFTVSEVKKTSIIRKPQPPFTTSTLQQEASKRLGFNPTRTMQVAQKLYEGIDSQKIEGGLITYMRTDGVQIEDNVINEIRNNIEVIFGAGQVPQNKNIYQTKSKNAQESHEAIRPTSITNAPEKIKAHLSDEQFKLYELIWKRTMASQMANAKFERTSITIKAIDNLGQNNLFRASGEHRLEAGYQVLFDDKPNDGAEKDLNEEKVSNQNVFGIEENESISCKKLIDNAHDTEPPPRFNPASLIKLLEDLGIGRPSTYASILSVLTERNYTKLEQKRFTPTSNGRLLTVFLENYYPDYVKYDFTADLEQKLDQISNGDFTRISLLEDFYSNLDMKTKNVKDIERIEVMENLVDTLAPHIFGQDSENPRLCPDCSGGKITLKSFESGSFLCCSNYPDCNFQHGLGKNDAIATQKQVIAIDPMTGNEITLQSGRYGPYLEVEDSNMENDKPKRVSIPRNIKLEDLSDELALQLISLPKSIGNHPETNQEITGAIGRYGPYIKHENTYVSIKLEDLFAIGLNRAVTLIDEKNKVSPSSPNQILGQYPKTKNDIILSSGRYGPYLKYKKKNYSVGKNISVETLNLEEAIKIIDLKDKKN